MRYVSILFLCLVFVSSSFATTYYVSLSGNNSNDGSSGRPWRTIQYAATKVPAGQGHTIQVAAGTFVENQIHVPQGVHLIGAGRDATIIKSNSSFYYYPASPGFSNDRFLIRFYSGGVVSGNQSIKNLTIDGDGKKLHGGVFIHNRNNVVVENIKVQYVNFSGIWLSSSNNSTVKNIVLKDCAWGSASWCSAALQFANSANLDISGFDIDEARGYGIKTLGHDQNAPLNNVKLHHGKVSVHQVGLWNGGSAPNITIEFWASGYNGTEIYNTYVDNHISIINPKNAQSSTPLKIYNNVFDIAGTRTKGSGYCIELSSSSVEIKNNYFYGGYYGVVNWANTVYTNWNIHHNVFYALSGGGNPTSVICSYRGGVQNLNLYNNTVEMSSTSQAVHFVEFDNSSRGTNVNVKNNLIINPIAANKVLNLRNGASISNLNVTNNFFQNIAQGTVGGNYSANSTGTASVTRSGNRPQTFYNHSSGGNLIDKGVNVGLESKPDIGACGDGNVIGTAAVGSTPSPTPTPSPVTVTGVTVSPTSLSLGINATSTLGRTIAPSNASNQAVTWTSSNTAIARVDANGVVTGVAAGSASITVRTTDGGRTASATVTVTAAASNGVNGLLTRAVWNGIPGEPLTSLKSNGNYPNSPSTQGTISSFNSPSGVGDNYGSRIYGYLRPQTTGAYTFWIAGDDYCELYLSTDQNAANKTLIANVPGWTMPNELAKYPQQKSVTKNLTAGQYYFIEALQKEAGGGDFVTVYWQGPGISQSVISSAFISTTAPSAANVATTGVSISPTSFTLSTGATRTMARTISPSNASNQGVTWSSSNSNIARVDAAGVVTGVAAGTATITVRTNDGGRTANATVTVSASAAQQTVPAVNGVLTRAVWTGIPGDFLTALKASPNFPNSPNSTSTVSTFAGPTNWADNYGSRIYGYIRPQTTGAYTFWIAGDNNCELYLSTDQNPANKSLIARVTSYTMAGELNKIAEQKSVTKNLVAGQFYFVEALHKDGLGGEHVAVWWQGPGIAQSIIGSAYLSTSAGSGGSGGSPENSMAGIFEEESAESQFVVYPVPVESGQDLTVEVPAYSSMVKVIDMHGKEHNSVPVNEERQVNVPTRGLESGIYYLQVLHSRGSEYKKVMVR